MSEEENDTMSPSNTVLQKKKNSGYPLDNVPQEDVITASGASTVKKEQDTVLFSYKSFDSETDKFGTSAEPISDIYMNNSSIRGNMIDSTKNKNVKCTDE